MQYVLNFRMDLPEQFDVIVAGTGLIESIVSAACARVGKSVLHLDRNDFYGSVWASFCFDELNSYLSKIRDHKEKIQKNEKSSEEKWIDWSGEYYQPLSNVAIVSYLIEEEREKEETNEMNEQIPHIDNQKRDQQEVNEENVQLDEKNVDQNGLKKEDDEMNANSGQSEGWTREKLLSFNKYFNLDLCPRVIFVHV